MQTIDDLRPRSAPAGHDESHLCGCPPQQIHPSSVTGISRRQFFARAAAAGVVGGLFAEGLSTRLAFGAAAYTGDTLVVLSLRGGFDSIQAVVPNGDVHYATWRPTVAIPQNATLQLDSMFGLHPSLSMLKPHYDAGRLGFVAAVGMEEPNRSHFQAMEEMERAAPGSSLRTGWLDRVLGLRDHASEFQAVEMGSSLPPTVTARASTGARDVVGRLVRARRGVEPRGARALGRGATRAARQCPGAGERRRRSVRSERSRRRATCRTRATRSPRPTRTPILGTPSQTSPG